MPASIVPVLIAHHTPRWVRVAVGSFRKHVGISPIIVVDNNPERGEPDWDPDCDAERAWLRAQPDVRLLPNTSGDRNHGAGIDRAVTWCRAQGAQNLLHFEPDCLISG